MSDAHLDYIRRTLRAVITRASRSGLAHPAAFVRESTQRRVQVATQALTMLEHVAVDDVAFAKALGWEPPYYVADLQPDVRRTLAREYVAGLLPPAKEVAP